MRRLTKQLGCVGKRTLSERINNTSEKYSNIFYIKRDPFFEATKPLVKASMEFFIYSSLYIGGMAALYCSSKLLKLIIN